LLRGVGRYPFRATLWKTPLQGNTLWKTPLPGSTIWETNIFDFAERCCSRDLNINLHQ
jgi:hypothetical protein